MQLALGGPSIVRSWPLYISQEACMHSGMFESHDTASKLHSRNQDCAARHIRVPAGGDNAYKAIS